MYVYICIYICVYFYAKTTPVSIHHPHESIALLLFSWYLNTFLLVLVLTVKMPVTAVIMIHIISIASTELKNTIVDFGRRVSSRSTGGVHINHKPEGKTSGAAVHWFDRLDKPRDLVTDTRTHVCCRKFNDN